MQQQRKRFSYLTVQQRALNSSNVIDSDKAANSRHGSIVKSHTKLQHTKQDSSTAQLYTSFSRNSSGKKNIQPLTEIIQNSIFSDIRTSTTKKPTISNKQNIPQRQSLKNDEKQYFPLTTKVLNESCIQTRVKQLEEQNSLILMQTQEKFLQMEKHLQKVEGILKEKENTIETLSNQNAKISQKCKCLKSENSQLRDQKEELLKIIVDKNDQIKKLMIQKQTFTQKQAQLLQQLNTYTLKSKLERIEIIQPTQPAPSNLQNQHQSESSSIQTQLKGIDIEQMIVRSKESQGAEKLNYRQKYEGLFKKALEMEDEMYRLKQELFDSQNQVKTIQQEFNTYKIFNQIQKINQQI